MGGQTTHVLYAALRPCFMHSNTMYLLYIYMFMFVLQSTTYRSYKMLYLEPQRPYSPPVAHKSLHCQGYKVAPATVCEVPRTDPNWCPEVRSLCDCRPHRPSWKYAIKNRTFLQLHFVQKTLPTTNSHIYIWLLNAYRHTSDANMYRASSFSRNGGAKVPSGRWATSVHSKTYRLNDMYICAVLKWPMSTDRVAVQY